MVFLVLDISAAVVPHFHFTELRCIMIFAFPVWRGSLLGALCGLSMDAFFWLLQEKQAQSTVQNLGKRELWYQDEIYFMYTNYFGKWVGGHTKSFETFPFWMKGLRT